MKLVTVRVTSSQTGKNNTHMSDEYFRNQLKGIGRKLSLITKSSRGLALVAASILLTGAFHDDDPVQIKKTMYNVERLIN